MKFPTVAIAAMTAAILFSGDRAAASTVDLSYQTPGSAYGAEGWYTRIDQTIVGRGSPVGERYRGTSGAFRFTDGINAILAFCMDPTAYLRINESFNVIENVSVSEDVDKLFTSSFADVADALSASAFQVALWEVLSETGPDFDASKGVHSVRNGKVAAQANVYLDRLATADTGRYRFTIYENGGQDQISVTAVPLPASALLLLAGLGGLAATRRKRA